MKCNNCGREFGSSITCQYCGIDRVVGLAEYPNGTFPAGTKNRKARDTIKPDGKKEQHSISTTKQTLSAQPQMLCWHCQEVIPGDSKFCPVCGTQLFYECPKCGNLFSAQYQICNTCGTNRIQFLKEKSEEEQRRREIEEERRIFEERQRIEEERRGEEMRLAITQFECSKWKDRSGNIIGVRVMYSGKNVKEYKLSIWNEHGDMLFPIQISGAGIDYISDETLFQCIKILGGSIQKVVMQLSAYGDNDRYDSSRIYISLLTFWFSPAQIKNIEGGTM